MNRELRRAGLARNIMIFFIGLAAAGLLIGVLNGPFESFVSTSQDLTNTQQAARGRQWIVTFWDAIPFVVVFLAFFQLLGAAAAERRVR
jgi:ABC-type methionine transport system permease subunit